MEYGVYMRHMQITKLQFEICKIWGSLLYREGINQALNGIALVVTTCCWKADGVSNIRDASEHGCDSQRRVWNSRYAQTNSTMVVIWLCSASLWFKPTTTNNQEQSRTTELTDCRVSHGSNCHIVPIKQRHLSDCSSMSVQIKRLQNEPKFVYYFRPYAWFHEIIHHVIWSLKWLLRNHGITSTVQLFHPR